MSAAVTAAEWLVVYHHDPDPDQVTTRGPADGVPMDGLVCLASEEAAHQWARDITAEHGIAEVLAVDPRTSSRTLVALYLDEDLTEFLAQQESEQHGQVVVRAGRPAGGGCS